MNKIYHLVVRYCSYNQPQINNKFIDLPSDILKEIFCKLDNKDIQSIVLVSKSWKTISINILKNQESFRIKKIKTFLTKNLNPKLYPELIEKLSNAISHEKISQSSTLKEVKSSIIPSKNLIVDLLKDVNEKDLDHLKNLLESESRPRFFEDLLDLAIIKKIMEAVPKEITSESKRIRITAKKFLKKGYFDQAIELANTSSTENQDKIFEKCWKKLFKIGQVDRAIEIATRISSLSIRKAIFHKLIKQQCRWLGLGLMASTFPVTDLAEYSATYGPRFLEEISIALAKANHTESALRIAEIISRSHCKFFALHIIAVKLWNDGKYEQAAEVARSITDPMIRYHTYIDFF